MSRTYKLKRFLRLLDEELLKQFLEKETIQIELPEKEEKEPQEVYWERVINSLPQAQINHIQAIFRDVNDLTTEGGILSLLEVGSKSIDDLPAQIKIGLTTLGSLNYAYLPPGWMVDENHKLVADSPEINWSGYQLCGGIKVRF